MAAVTETDIFQQQKKTIDTLINVLETQPATLQPQYIYATPAPAQKQSPNYLLWAGLGLLLFLTVKKGL
ncbi:MAG: hypothetical protein FVQ80_15255 [Planctomycetes bacterium]|nr:hypothetical protein [Planctomycetota bacterium]